MVVMDMSFRRKIGYIRRTGGHMDDDGYWQTGEEKQGEIFASVQPLNIREIEAMPEGQAKTSAIKLYASVPLLTSVQGTRQEADIVLWQGKRYVVTDCIPYQSGVIDHYKIIAREEAKT